ncbi:MULTISPECIES: MFS transporter [Bradyrhizobium]|uniref:MFS transporter n=1 Tax=Bradyrhizobium elkanii TaxID=29448 RepID=UPI00041EF1C6|nr:MFS transporter [Bradyrhizobium elkanii]
MLLGAIGAGAVGGAFGLPWMKTTFGPDRLVALGTVGTAVSLVLLGFTGHSMVALVACIVAGISLPLLAALSRCGLPQIHPFVL